MTDCDYGAFVSHYRELRLGSLDFGFVIAWREKLDSFAIADLLPAVADVAADSRASFPLNDLPLLIEHAKASREARERQSAPRKTWGRNPIPGEAWDRRMMDLGTISKEEFNRRQSARNAK